MLKRLNFFGIITAVLAVLLQMPLQAQEYKYTTVPNDPLNARIYTLANGLTVYMTVYKDAPRVQTYIATKAGSKNDPSDATGLAHYFEHMMFKGTGKIGTTDFSKEGPLIARIDSLFEVYRTIDPNEKDKRDALYKIIDSISTEASKYAIPNEYDKLLAVIGATGTNAYTSLEQTVYVNEIPSNQLENWLTIEAERFSNPVLRLFHTELETIYEEKNMTLTNDNMKVYFAMLAGLFKKHTYGTQTVIGTTDHLKSPSMKRIREYFASYYVPNNMAICLSGDLDPDKTIVLIDKLWGGIKPQPVPPFEFAKEDPITQPVIVDVTGPDAENITIAYRLEGANSNDALMLEIFDMILANSTAGLIDLDLVQKQKVLSASSGKEVMKDYSIEMLTGKPKEGQTLEQLKDLLLAEVEKIKKGEFDDWLIQAIITDLKLRETKDYEKNESRASAFVNSFVLGIPWSDYVNRFDRLSKITRQDVIDFANKNFNNNYLVINKKTGKNENIDKIKKPKITKININREDKSDFLKMIEANKVEDIAPVFIDYKTAITQFGLKHNIPCYYLNNTENKTFSMYYIFEMGTNNDRKLGLAIDYLKYLGTADLTNEQIKQEFFKIGCSFDVFNSSDQVYVSLRGLSENFEKGLSLFERLLAGAKPNPEALKNMVNDEMKKRKDAKLNPQEIFGAMVMYGIFGPKSPVTNILSEKELNALTAEELTNLITTLNSYEHHILFYGNQSMDEVKALLDKYHNTQAAAKPVPAEKQFPELATDQNLVYQVNFDMKQAQILMLSRSELFNAANEPVIKLYNEYFGGSMNSIVFQELREARGLCYAAMSFYQNLFGDKDKHYYNISFIMTQNDKIAEALSAFYELLNNMPLAEKSFDLAKNSLIQSMRTERITKSDILFSYESAKKLGLDYDIRRDLFERLPKLTFNDIQAFQANYVKGKAKTTLVLGNEELLDFKVLKKYGKVKKLKLKDIFGY